MQRFLRFVVALIAIAVAQAAAQETGTPAEDSAAYYAAGSAAFADGDYQKASDAFRLAIAAGHPGPSVRYNFAVALYQSGEYAAAETAFIDLGRQFPAMRPLADYNAGLALVRQRREAAAIDFFLDAADAGDPQVAALARVMLARLPVEEFAGSRLRSWVRLVEMTAGHDDNVALVDPLGLPAGVSSDSPFMEMSFFAGGPLAGSSWSLSTSAFLVEYTDADDFDQFGFVIGSRYENAAGPWRFSVGPQLGRTYIGGDGFEQYAGAGLGVTYAIPGTNTALDVDLSYDDLNEIDSQFAYLAGERTGLGIRLQHVLSRGRVSAEYRETRDDRRGDGVSADRERVRVNYRRAIGAAWLGDVSLEYREARYDRLQPAREESRTQAILRATRTLSGGWQLVAQYRFADNDSSDSLYAYDRHRFAAGLSRYF